MLNTTFKLLKIEELTPFLQLRDPWGRVLLPRVGVAVWVFIDDVIFADCGNLLTLSLLQRLRLYLLFFREFFA